MNTVALTGRLTADPVLRRTQAGEPVCNLRLAVDGMGAGGRQDVGYVDVACFGPAGQAAADTLSQGWLVAVEGRLNWRTYESQHGPRQAISVIGRVEFLTAPQTKREPAGEPAAA